MDYILKYISIDSIDRTAKNFARRRVSRERKREKIDKTRNAEKIDPVKLQMEHEANRLLSFYIWYLLAGTKELTFGEMAEKVNQKFKGLVSEKDLAKTLVDNGRLRGDPFFNCAAEGLKDRIVYFLQFTLRKRLISLQRSFGKANNVLDSLYRLEKRQQQIRDIELKTLLNPRLTYRANRDSPWWSVYQREMDRGLHLARLNNLFPDKETKKIYE